MTQENRMNEIVEHEETLPQVVEQADSLLAVIERAATNPDVDVDKMSRLLDMHERITSKRAEVEFNAALSRVQSTVPPIKKASKAHNSTYAKLEDIEKVVRPIYSAEGFSIGYTSKDNGNTKLFIATLRHKDGHSEHYEYEIPADNSGSKNAIQAMGSSTSYARRNLLCMMFNIVTTDEDDDGNSGGSQLLDAGQVATLESMIKTSGASRGAYLDYMGVSDLSALPQSRFKEALNALKKKAEKQ